MNRLVVFPLVLALTLSVLAGGLSANAPAQTQSQTQSQTQTRLQTGDCVCDGPNCDADCPQNSYQKKNGNAYQGEFPDDVWNWFRAMLSFCFGGGK
jgi:hypothetical protein